jgi:hypothetical protein
MTHKPVISQLYDFLAANPSVQHGGALQRMDFKTRTGGLATGDNIKRRLNELVEEGKILVTYNDKHEAMFSIKEGFEKKLHVDLIKHPLTGELITTKQFAAL